MKNNKTMSRIEFKRLSFRSREAPGGRSTGNLSRLLNIRLNRSEITFVSGCPGSYALTDMSHIQRENIKLKWWNLHSIMDPF
jgi:hypothetical protein